jgi:hypothetical protein
MPSSMIRRSHGPIGPGRFVRWGLVSCQTEALMFCVLIAEQ